MSDEDHSRKDDILIGQLIANVANLTTQVGVLTKKVERMEEKLNTGKGFLIGAIMLSGALGASAGHVIEKLLK